MMRLLTISLRLFILAINTNAQTSDDIISQYHLPKQY